MVRRLCRTVLGHLEDADDAAQNAFLSAWNALDRFDRKLELGPWLARIALNAARDLRRRRTVRSTEPIPLTLMAEGPGPEAGTDRELLAARLREALGTLPERQRLALILFEVEGYAQTEIATLLAAPEGTIRSEIFHARRRLRALLGAPEESRS